MQIGNIRKIEQSPGFNSFLSRISLLPSHSSPWYLSPEALFEEEV